MPSGGGQSSSGGGDRRGTKKSGPGGGGQHGGAWPSGKIPSSYKKTSRQTHALPHRNFYGSPAPPLAAGLQFPAHPSVSLHRPQYDHLDASVAPFQPQAVTVPVLSPFVSSQSAALGLTPSYAAVLKSAGQVCGALASAPASAQAITDLTEVSDLTHITQTTENPAVTLTAASVSPQTLALSHSEGSAWGHLSASAVQSEKSRLKSPRASQPYLAEFKRLEEQNFKKRAARAADTQKAGLPSRVSDVSPDAPTTEPFPEYVDPTEDIIHLNSHKSQGSRAIELSQISPATVSAPNLQFFNGIGPFTRNRVSAFPQTNQNHPSLFFQAPATTLGQISAEPSFDFTESAPNQRVRRGLPLKQGLLSRSGQRNALRMPNQSFSQSVKSSSDISHQAPHSNITSRCSMQQQQLVTPTKSSLNTSQSSTQASPLDRPNDTPEQKQKIQGVMSAFKEVGGTYDQIEWLHNGDKATHSESPEPLTVPAQPVASYTTVGSLKPAANQQFTAPNRIQRDGTGRRAAQANLHGRGHDINFSYRSSSQAYNVGHGSSSNAQLGSMNYNQYGSASQPHFDSSAQAQLGSMNHTQHAFSSQSRLDASAHFHQGNMSQSQYALPNQSQHGTSSQSPYASLHQRQQGSLTQHGFENQPGFGSANIFPNLSSTSSMALTDAEKSILKANGLTEPLTGPASRPFMHSGNVPSRQRQHNNDPSLNPQAQSFNVLDQPNDNGFEHSTFAQSTASQIQDTQKNTQTNSFTQPLIGDQLSGFARSHAQRAAASTGVHFAQRSVQNTTVRGQSNNASNVPGYSAHQTKNGAVLDQNYRFPPPGLAYPTQANQAGSGYGQHTVSNFGSYEPVISNQHQQVHTGRPQPLTAGPPGQRQNVSSLTQGISSNQSLRLGSSVSASLQTQTVHSTRYPWLHNSRNNMFTTVPTENSRITDTLPMEEIRQYYPNGFPSDMTGRYTRRDSHGMSKKQNNTATGYEWFQASVSDLDKTPGDHVAELEDRNRNLQNGTPVEPPLIPDELSQRLSILDILNMPEAEVGAHLIGPAFGSFIRYADQRGGPNSRRALSRYAVGASWVIDESPDGNRSVFTQNSGPESQNPYPAPQNPGAETQNPTLHSPGAITANQTPSAENQNSGSVNQHPNI